MIAGQLVGNPAVHVVTARNQSVRPSLTQKLPFSEKVTGKLQPFAHNAKLWKNLKPNFGKILRQTLEKYIIQYI